ncbi:MAG TPA: nicotinate-nicotinamide nucleotide adenylyltransferase [Candidatus Krumholzibacteria bacterium]|nr:nicotinate-nicotinamide nucleotide adenylyltransferase [Candidatus Krumholzibacteria bacterium]HPD71709.1 nicotinate-nicotinamide nucleotide adenylyltransferase [Candidatus Krumholzibacteria bacterium]HRY41358.1 nicotinate-nicotinamide nucleotide adenylyltransferase [Candidatus Krumholzibacteria bacterium]
MIRALYGGTFDPVHAGHVAVVRLLRERRLAEVVHVAVAWQSPLKADLPGAPAADRLRMVELALGGQRGVVVESGELAQPRPSFTVETLARLVAEHPGARWRLVIGADAAADFARWRDPARLLRLAEPLVVARGPVVLAPPLAGRGVVVGDFDHPASATSVRTLLAAGRLPGPELLPAAVADYIVARGLYGWPAPPPGKESP